MSAWLHAGHRERRGARVPGRAVGQVGHLARSAGGRAPRRSRAPAPARFAGRGPARRWSARPPPPASVTRQQSSRLNGQQIIRESSTSSTVIGSRIHRLRVQRRPLARRDRDLGQLLLGRAVLGHVPRCWPARTTPAGRGSPNGSSNWPSIVGRWRRAAASRLCDRPLSPWVISATSQRPSAMAAAACATWITKEPAADVGAVHDLRLDPEVLADLGGRDIRREQAVHVLEGQAGVAQGVAGALRVKLQHRLVGDDPDLGPTRRRRRSRPCQTGSYLGISQTASERKPHPPTPSPARRGGAMGH